MVPALRQVCYLSNGDDEEDCKMLWRLEVVLSRVLIHHHLRDLRMGACLIKGLRGKIHIHIQRFVRKTLLWTKDHEDFVTVHLITK